MSASLLLLTLWMERAGGISDEAVRRFREDEGVTGCETGRREGRRGEERGEKWKVQIEGG